VASLACWIPQSRQSVVIGGVARGGAAGMISGVVRSLSSFATVGVLVVVMFVAPGGAHAGRLPAQATPTPTVTPTPSGALGDATVARPGSERVTSTGGPLPAVQPAEIEGFPICPHMNREVTAAAVRMVARASLCLINKLRRQRHLRALKGSSQLLRAANRHARDMVAARYFSHDSPDGRGVSDRVKGTRYVRGYARWQLGENLAWGSGLQSTARRIVLAWMGSPGHKRNLLKPGYREAGLAVVAGSPVESAGSPAGTYANVFGRRSR
jgi:uncharacterized protein YkwD